MSKVAHPCSPALELDPLVPIPEFLPRDTPEHEELPQLLH